MKAAAASRAARWRMPLLAALLLGLLALLAISGQWPELRSKVAFAPKGLVTIAPPEVHRVAIRSGSESIALVRQASGWSIEGVKATVPAEVAKHLDTALRLVNVGEVAREIPARDLTAASFADFGLDPPALVAAIEANSGAAATINFGALNPASTSHYIRLTGRPAVALMPRHVAEEWRVAFDIAGRFRDQAGHGVVNRGKDLLLPVSMAQVWAIEIVFAGRLTRFERDPDGNWYRHLGQHSHAAGDVTHVADPEQARIIDAALRAFDSSAIETRIGRSDPSQVTRYGLNLPSLILLVFGRDSSTPLARVEFGMSADPLNRYARLAPDGAVITVAEFEMRRLTELLRAVGAAS